MNRNGRTPVAEPAPTIGLVRGFPRTYEVTPLWPGSVAVTPAAQGRTGELVRATLPVTVLAPPPQYPMLDRTDPNWYVTQTGT